MMGCAQRVLIWNYRKVISLIVSRLTASYSFAWGVQCLLTMITVSVNN